MATAETEEEIRRRYEALEIEEEEIPITGLNVQKAADELNEFHYVGVLFTDKEFNETAFRRTISNVWQPRYGVNIKTIANKRFLFTFFHRYDYDKVWAGGPWNFMNKLLALAPRKADVDPDSIISFRVPIWVQIFGVPLGYVSMKVCEVMGNFIGELLEVDENNFKVSRPQYLRIRVAIDPAKVLKRKMKMRLNDVCQVTVQFQYERLPSICFICGMFQHTVITCPLNYVGKDPPKHMYDPSIRASLRRNMITEEDKWLRDERGCSLLPTGSIVATTNQKGAMDALSEEVEVSLSRCSNAQMEMEVEVADPKRKRMVERLGVTPLPGKNSEPAGSDLGVRKSQ